MANIVRITTPGGRFDDLVCVHNPCWLEFTARLLHETNSDDLTDVYLTYDGVDYKPYLYSTDATYNYYRIDLKEIFKASMPDYDFDNHASESVTAANLYTDEDLVITATYETSGDSTLTTNYILFHAAKNTGELSFNEKAFENTYYDSRKVFYFHGYPFNMFSYLSDFYTDNGCSITCNDRTGLSNSEATHGNVLQQLGQYQIVSFYAYDNTTVRDIGSTSANEGRVSYDGSQYRMRLSDSTIFSITRTGTQKRYLSYNLDFIFDPITSGATKTLITYNSGTTLKIGNTAGVYYLIVDGGTDDPSYQELYQIKGPGRYLLTMFTDEDTGYYYIVLNGQLFATDTNALLDFSYTAASYTLPINGYLYSIFVFTNHETEYTAPIYQIPGEESYTIDACSTLSSDFTMISEFKTGVYLRWLTRDGIYQGYLFECYYGENVNSSEIGEILNNDKDYELIGPSLNSILVPDSRTKSLGKTSQRSISVETGLIDNEEFNYVLTIVDSPEVYLFLKPIGAKDEPKNWERVKIDVGYSGTNKNKKQRLQLTVNRSEQYNINR